MPRVEWNEENMRYAVCFFPLIGLVSGGLCWLWFFLALRLSLGILLRTAGLVLIPLLVTGGIHVDGLLDTADAVSSYRSREERLSILKDSHVGAFAVIWGIAYFIAAFGVLSETDLSMMPRLMLIFACARAMSGYALVRFEKAKRSGLLYLFSDAAASDAAAAVMILVTAACGVLLIVLRPASGAAVLAAGLLCLFLYRRKSMKLFGGITGDLAGCFLCCAELFMTLCMVIAG